MSSTACRGWVAAASAKGELYCMPSVGTAGSKLVSVAVAPARSFSCCCISCGCISQARTLPLSGVGEVVVVVGVVGRGGWSRSLRHERLDRRWSRSMRYKRLDRRSGWPTIGGCYNIRTTGRWMRWQWLNQPQTTAATPPPTTHGLDVAVARIT